MRIAARVLGATLATLLASRVFAQGTDSTTLVVVPARVFDAAQGVTHDGWIVVVRGDRISAVGPRGTVAIPASARRIDLPRATLLPGLIEGHGHLFLHPYVETPWADQVLEEPLALRVARATVMTPVRWDYEPRFDATTQYVR